MNSTCVLLPLVEQSFPYLQSLTLRPGGEIEYRYRVGVRSRAKGSSPHLALPTKCRAGADGLRGCGAAQRAAPLGSSSEIHRKIFHSKQGTPGYGLAAVVTRFTPLARRQIRWGGAAIESEFGLKRCFFLTGTLPGSTQEAIDTFAIWASWFQDNVNKWLARNATIDDECYRLSVWELQKRGALHLHALVASEDSDLPRKFREYWWSLLETLSQHTGVDLFAKSNGQTWRDRSDYRTRKGKTVGQIAADGQVVTKSVTAYLSKYLTKASSGGVLSGLPPVRWWSMSVNVKKLISKWTVTYELPRCSAQSIDKVLDFVKSALQDCCNAWGETLIEKFKKSCGFVGFMPHSEAELLSQAITEVINGELVSETQYQKQVRLSEAVQDLRVAKEHDDFERECAAWAAVDKAFSWIERSKMLQRMRKLWDSM